MSARRNQERPGPPALVAPREEALAALDQQLAEGVRLQNITPMSGDQFDEFRLAVRKWRDATTERLRRMFDHEEYANKFYSAAQVARIVSTPRVGTSWGFTKDDYDQLLRRLQGALVVLEGYRDLVRDGVIGPAVAVAAPVAEARFRDVHIHLGDGAALGQVNVGAAVQNIQSHINALVGPNADDVARAFKELTEAAVSDDSLDDSARAELIEHYEDLSEQGAAPPERRRLGRITAALERIPAVLGAATNAREAWDQWGPTIEGFFRQH